MSSEPSPNPTPPPTTPGPGAGGPSPQKIGAAFIRQYYKTLLENPANLNRFYQPDSTVTRGMEPSSPAAPAPFAVAPANGGDGSDSSPGERVRQAFFSWAGEGVVIDFERGAIDAQESIGGGILLVVTGRAYLPGSEDGCPAKASPSPFVHTFFLNNNAGAGRKKMFLISNDILRFLDAPVEAAPATETDEAPVVVEEPAVVEEAPAAPAAVEEPEPVVEEPEPVVEEPEPVAPVEETAVEAEPAPAEPVEFEPSAEEEKVVEEDESAPAEEVALEVVDVEPAADEEKADAETSSAGSDEASPAASPSADGNKKKKNRKKRGGKSRSRSNSPQKEEEAKPVEEETPEKPKVPGSWASLVASGGGSAQKTTAAAPDSAGKKGGRKGASPKTSRSGPTAEKDTASSTQESTAKAPPQSQPAKDAAAAAAKAAVSSSPAAPTSKDTRQDRRIPEATLFIRNIPDKTTEPEIRGLFESHGAKTGHKITGITLNTNRGFCFVDFDGTAAVDAIVSEANTSLVKDQRTGRKVTSSFMVHGRVLDVERKVQPDRNKGRGSGGAGGGNAGRTFNRSHSPKDGGGRYRGSRGGMRRSPPRGGGHQGGGGASGGNR